jgi:hypothetical protein
MVAMDLQELGHGGACSGASRGEGGGREVSEGVGRERRGCSGISPSAPGERHATASRGAWWPCPRMCPPLSHFLEHVASNGLVDVGCAFRPDMGRIEP